MGNPKNSKKIVTNKMPSWYSGMTVDELKKNFEAGNNPYVNTTQQNSKGKMPSWYSGMTVDEMRKKFEAEDKAKATKTQQQKTQQPKKTFFGTLGKLFASVPKIFSKTSNNTAQTSTSTNPSIKPLSKNEIIDKQIKSTKKVNNPTLPYLYKNSTIKPFTQKEMTNNILNKKPGTEDINNLYDKLFTSKPGDSTLKTEYDTYKSYAKTNIKDKGTNYYNLMTTSPLYKKIQGLSLEEYKQFAKNNTAEYEKIKSQTNKHMNKVYGKPEINDKALPWYEVGLEGISQGMEQVDVGFLNGIKLLNRHLLKSNALNDTLETDIEQHENEMAKSEGNMKGTGGFGKFAYQGISGATAMLPTLVSGGAMGSAASTVINTTTKAGKFIYKAAQMSPFFVHSFSSYAREAELDGANEDQQLLYGLTGATIETITEAPFVTKFIDVPGNFISNKILFAKGGKRLTKIMGATAVDFVFGLLAEGFQEAVTDPLTHLARKNIYKPDEQWTEEDTKGMLQSGLGGVSMAIILDGLNLKHTMSKKRSELLLKKYKDDIENGKPPTVEQVAKDTQKLLPQIEKDKKAAESEVTNPDAIPISEVQLDTLPKGPFTQSTSQNTPTQKNDTLSRLKRLSNNQKNKQYLVKGYGRVEVTKDNGDSVVVKNEQGESIKVGKNTLENITEEPPVNENVITPQPVNDMSATNPIMPAQQPIPQEQPSVNKQAETINRIQLNGSIVSNVTPDSNGNMVVDYTGPDGNKYQTTLDISGNILNIKKQPTEVEQNRLTDKQNNSINILKDNRNVLNDVILDENHNAVVNFTGPDENSYEISFNPNGEMVDFKQQSKEQGVIEQQPKEQEVEKQETKEQILENLPDNDVDTVKVKPIKVKDINVDPQRFQFKSNTNPETGASSQLSGTDKFVPEKAGVLTLWEDKEGKLWVVNGHHRLELAKRSKQRYVNAQIIREADGWTDKDARVLGAEINIADNRATATDAAKIFRDRNYSIDELKGRGLSLKDGLIKKGYYISKLNDRLFNNVINGTLSEEQGAVIGEELEGDNASQNAVMDILEKVQSTGKSVSKQRLLDYIYDVKSGDTVIDEQITLLGTVYTEKSLSENKYSIRDGVITILKAQKSLFANLSNAKKAEMAKMAGNVLADNKNAEMKQLTEQAIEAVYKLSRIKGSFVSNIFNKYAAEMEKGMSKTEAIRQAYGEIESAIKEGKIFEELNGNTDRSTEVSKQGTELQGENEEQQSLFDTKPESKPDKKQENTEVKAPENKEETPSKEKSTENKKEEPSTIEQYIDNIVSKIQDEKEAARVKNMFILLIEGAKKAGVDVSHSIELIDKINDEITDSLLKSHGLEGEGYIAGKTQVNYDGKLFKAIISLAYDENRPITQEVIHEYAEIWNSIWKYSNPQQYKNAVDFLVRRGIDRERAEEHLTEILTDYTMNKDFDENTDKAYKNFFKKMFDGFVKWLKDVLKRLSYFRKNVLPHLSEDIKQQAEDFASGNWEKAFNSLKGHEGNIEDESYAVKEKKRYFTNENGLIKMTNYNGTVLQRYKDNVGKLIGNQIYVHRNYATEVIPAEPLNKAKRILNAKYPDFKYNAIMYDLKDGTVRFDSAPDFDTAREPITGSFIKINPSTGETKTGYSPQIWHHKWMWVKNDYKGFDVDKAAKWSYQFSNQVEESPSGYIKKWRKQLEKYNVSDSITDKETHKNRMWVRGKTEAQIKSIKQFSALYEKADKPNFAHPTQAKITISTYQQFFNFLKNIGFKGKVLDASSGYGLGTKVGRDMGFNVDDVEPYPNETYKPMYTKYSDVKGKYDIVISSYVLNVVPQDIRDGIVKDIGKFLKPSGKAYIFVRGTDVLKTETKIPIDESQMEYYIANSKAYQKGFKPDELVSYLEDTLGDGYRVEYLDKSNSGLSGKIGAIVTKVNTAKELDISDYGLEIAEIRNEYFIRSDKTAPIGGFNSHEEALTYAKNNADIIKDYSDSSNIKEDINDLEAEYKLTKNDDPLEAKRIEKKINTLKKKLEIAKKIEGDKLAREKVAAKKTKINDILKNLYDYRMDDIESLINQVHDVLGIVDDDFNFNDLSDTESRNYLKEQLLKIPPLERQLEKHGLYVRPTISKGNITDTAPFKRWFNGSKVVDESGKPIVVYHGTNHIDITSFKKGISWFAKEPSLANDFTQGSSKFSNKKTGGNIIPAYIRIKNPLNLKNVPISQEISARELLRRGGLSEDLINKVISDSYKNKPSDDKDSDWKYDETGILMSKGGSISKTRSFNFFNAENFVQALKSNGFDGLIWHEGNSDTYAVFSPSQIKSATGNNGEFNPEINDIRYSAKDKAPVFYSQLEKTISSKMPNKAVPSEILRLISASGVKEEEIEWSGIREWLQEQQGKVTKDEVLNYIKTNNVEVKEIHLKETDGRGDFSVKGWEKYVKKEYMPEHIGIVIRDYIDVNNAIHLVDFSGNVIDYFIKKYGDYFNDEFIDMLNKENDKSYTRNMETRQNYTLHGGKNYFELVLWTPEAEDMPTDSMHFSTGKGKKNIAWVRATDRTNEKGENILFIEEIQSNRHQKGREIGYGKDKVPNAPYKKSWMELCLRRMIRYAAENGYDRIAWTTGEQQADRYNLSKVISIIKYEKASLSDQYSISAYDKRGSLIFDRSAITSKYMEELVGKDIAEKIVNSKEYRGSIEGMDLDFGGEGMKTFYNKMIPSYLNKYVKKWDSKVETTELVDKHLSWDKYCDYLDENNINTPVRTKLTANSKQGLKDKVLDYAYDNYDDFRHLNNNVTKTLEIISNNIVIQWHGPDYIYDISEYNKHDGIILVEPIDLIISDHGLESVGLNVIQQSIKITPAMKESVLYEGQPLFTLKSKGEYDPILETYKKAFPESYSKIFVSDESTIKKLNEDVENPFLSNQAKIPIPMEYKDKGIVLFRKDNNEELSMPESKPQGLYMSFRNDGENIYTPHTNEGKNNHFVVGNIKNPLIFNDDGKVLNSRGTFGISAGVGAVKLLDPDNFENLNNMTKTELKKYIQQKYPDIQGLDNYYDHNELMEVLGARLAKDSGYDSIVGLDKTAPILDEIVILKNEGIKQYKETQQQTEQAGNKANYSLNKELHGIEISFPDKPDQSLINTMKANGFRWNGKKSVWYAKDSAPRRVTAQKVIDEYNKNTNEVQKPQNDNIIDNKEPEKAPFNDDDIIRWKGERWEVINSNAIAQYVGQEEGNLIELRSLDRMVNQVVTIKWDELKDAALIEADTNRKRKDMELDKESLKMRREFHTNLIKALESDSELLELIKNNTFQGEFRVGSTIKGKIKDHVEEVKKELFDKNPDVYNRVDKNFNWESLTDRDFYKTVYDMVKADIDNGNIDKQKEEEKQQPTHDKENKVYKIGDKVTYEGKEFTIKNFFIDDNLKGNYVKLLEENGSSESILYERFKELFGELEGAKPKNFSKITAPKGNPQSHAVALEVKELLNKGQKFTYNDLTEIGNRHFGGTLAEGKYSPKDLTDAMELGINMYLLEQKDIDLTSKDPEVAKENIKKLEKLLELIPTQTKRTDEMVEFQQFSTPPTIAYIASWVANISKNDTVLEPSAGIGGLALFAKANGAKVIVNEYSDRRLEVVKNLEFDGYYNENAEQLDNILPDDIKPTLVIMNPPFSATAGRMEGKTNSKNALPHIEQALLRLEDGGRMVAIVGKGMEEDSPAFREWWSNIKTKYRVRCNIGIDGSNYTKYGTSFDIRLFVIDKVPPVAGETTITGNFKDITEAINVLEGIKNDRKEILSADTKGKLNANKSGSQEITGTGQSRNGTNDNLHSPTNSVGNKAETSNSTGTEGNPNADSSKFGHTDVSNTTNEGNGNGENSVKGNTGNETSRSSGNADRGNQVGNDRQQHDVKVETLSKEEQKEQSKIVNSNSDSVYSKYLPSKLRIPGAKPHMGDLAESSAMAAVEPPDPKYKPNLPQRLIELGKLSLAQLEAIVYAGQSHSVILPDGRRRGFFIGDGTGVGKGREIAGIILDNFRQGRKKAVWITKNDDLLVDAIRDWTNIEQDASQITNLKKTKPGKKIVKEDGILFASYGLLRQELEQVANGILQVKEGKTSRVDQIVEWLGKDFDGVIVFDEAHLMQQNTATAGKRGMKKASVTALAGIDLQEKLPNARIVYVSATGATDVANFGYAERLGLWGEGTSFADKNKFIDNISSSGLAAMELIARDMKAMGVYIARTLSYDGVGYETLQHTLSPEQTKIYDNLANAWQIVLQNINAALAVTHQDKNGNARGKQSSIFWGANQRFFNQILTSMQMPSVIEAINEDIKRGDAVVLQIVNTNEATQNRQIAQIEEEEGSIEDMDLTPRDILLQYLDKSFPVQQFEEYTDEHGNKRSRPVYDRQGNPVINKQALEMKKRLMDQVASIKIPEGPLEMILNTFGTDIVAEVTGRKRRVVVKNGKKILEQIGDKHAEADINAFMDDKKQILVFSGKGNTGKSYHADKTSKNQRHRRHYLIQAGFRADSAVQGFGRTHRTNEASAPTYILVTTNLKGQKRFISTIARRLDQMGALTKGQRQTGSQGLFSQKDNLETPLAIDTLQRFFYDLGNNRIKGVNAIETLRKMGLDKHLLDEYRRFKDDATITRDMSKFLNRLLCLDSELQNKVFDGFFYKYESMVEAAIQNGNFDVGLENLTADKIATKQEVSIRKDKTGAETKYVELEAGYKVYPLSFESALPQTEKEKNNFVGFYQNTRSKYFYAVYKGPQKTLANGNVVDSYNFYTQKSQFVQSNITASEFEKGHYEKIENMDTAKTMWNEKLSQVPEYNFQKVHLITGALLPIWDRLPQGFMKVYKVNTDDGNTYLGRVISDDEIDSVLRKLDAERSKDKVNNSEVINRVYEDGYRAKFVNGWTLKRAKIAGEYRLEIDGPSYTDGMILKKYGVFTETIQYAYRYFIPIGEQAIEILNKITEYKPIADLKAPEKSQNQSREEAATIDDSELPQEIQNPLVLGEEAAAISPMKKKQKESPVYNYKKPGLQADIEQAHGVTPEGFIERMKRNAIDFKNFATRTNKFLDENDPFLAEIVKDVTLINKLRDMAQDEAINLMHNLIKDLKKAQFKVFEAKALFDDLEETAKQNLNLPFGLDSGDVSHELSYINKDLSPEAIQAIKDRLDMWKRVVNEFKKAMKAIGYDMDDKLNRSAYYRHMILQYAVDKGTTTGKKLKIPKNSGYQKQRLGSELAINSKYLEAEFEVLSQMLYDTALAKTIKNLRDNYDVSAKLKEQAKLSNEQALKDHINSEISAGNVDSKGRTPTQVELLKYKKKMAYSFKQIADLYYNGQLWVGKNKEYESIAATLAQRLSSTKNQDSKVLKYLSELAGQSDSTPGAIQARTILAAIGQRNKFIKDTLGAKYKNWEDLIPEGYVKWKIDENHIFYRTKSIPDSVVNNLIASGLGAIGITENQIRSVMAVGGTHAEWVIREDVAQALSNLVKEKKDDIYHRFFRAVNNGMKRWLLYANPKNLIPYNINNMFGDLDKVIATNPKILKKKYIVRAFNELMDAFKKGVFTKDLMSFRNKGGFQALSTVQEISTIDTQKVFRKFSDKKQRNPVKAYMEFAENATNFRESILRYAAYLYYREDLFNNNGVPSQGYGASKRAMVEGLKNWEDRAYKLSKDALGSYDEISELGQNLRNTIMPFYSWIEVNFSTYTRLFYNIATDDELCNKVGRKLLGSVADIQKPTIGKKKEPLGRAISITTGRSILLGRQVLRCVTLMALLAAFNSFVHPDEEDELPEEVKKKPHLIIGRDSDGDIIYLNRLGALPDFLEWFGIENAPDEFQALMNGKMPIKDYVGKMAKAPVNKLVQAVTPFIKTPAEYATGTSLYPDVFSPKPVRDKNVQLAQTFDLAPEYRLIAGLPHRSYLDSLSEYVTKKVKPKEAAYYDTLTLKQEFEKKEGKSPLVIQQAPKYKALYNYKLALKYNDEAAALKYLREYASYCETLKSFKKGIKQSTAMLDPLYGLDNKEKNAFIDTLTDKQIVKVRMALEYYEEVILFSKELGE